MAEAEACMTTFTAGGQGSEWLLRFRHALRTTARYSRASTPHAPLPFLSWISRRSTRKVEVFFDVQSSGFDYSNVFGGGGGGAGGGLDFAVSYEDLLFDLSNGRDFHSSEEDEEACANRKCSARKMVFVFAVRRSVQADGCGPATLPPSYLLEDFPMILMKLF